MSPVVPDGYMVQRPDWFGEGPEHRPVVMHLLNTGSYSGAENVVISIISKMSDQVEGIYVSPGGSIREALDANGIRHYVLAKVDAPSVRRAIRDIRPDVIHAHDRTASVFACLSTAQIPIVSHLHNNTPWMRSLDVRTVVYGMSCPRYGRILTVSDSVMDEFVFGGLFKGKTTVIGNPVLVDDIRAKAKAAGPGGGYDLLFLGRFSPQKNPLLFVRVVEQCRASLLGLRAAMVGRGELEGEVRCEVEARGLADCVDLPGFVANPYGVLAASKVLCVPSSWEGFGMAAVEALALGTPVVAANVGGLPGIVDESCGRLCKSEGDYVEEIVRLLTDDAYRSKKERGALHKADGLENGRAYFESIYRTYIGLGRNSIGRSAL